MATTGAGFPDGPIVARGRDAVLIDIGAGRLLRKFPGPRDLSTEVAVMRHVAAAGFPVPEVYDVHDGAMVLERIDGPTMLDHLARRPWLLGRHARVLAGLHTRLHRIAAPPEWRLSYGTAGTGPVVTHGDFHPGNVILGRDGPVVIDWTNGGRGLAAEEIADVWLLLAAARPDGGRAMQLLTTVLRRRFVSIFLQAVHRGDPNAGLREAAAGLLAAAAERRALDHNMSHAENQAMAEVVRRFETADPALPSDP